VDWTAPVVLFPLRSLHCYSSKDHCCQLVRGVEKAIILEGMEESEERRGNGCTPLFAYPTYEIVDKRLNCYANDKNNKNRCDMT